MACNYTLDTLNIVGDAMYAHESRGKVNIIYLMFNNYARKVLFLNAFMKACHVKRRARFIVKSIQHDYNKADNR